MSRLVNFGLGDVIDRLTILSLKILHGEYAGKDCKHFRTERAALLPRLNTTNCAWYELGLELAAVNSALWQAEDEMRGYRNGPAFMGLNPVSGMAEVVATCAFRIQDLNDRRADLITQINVRAGEHTGREKLNGESRSENQ